MKIVITDAMTVTQGDIDLKVFSKYGELYIYDRTSEDELKRRISDADIVLCNKTVLSEDVLKSAQKLKFIGLFATGYNNIDTNYCTRNNIIVSNAPGYSTNAVAQHTFALILEYFSRVGKYSDFTASGQWNTSPVFSPFVYPTNELAHKTIGIIGYGSIGQHNYRFCPCK